MEITKYALPVVAGTVLGMVLLISGEYFIHNSYPLLPGTDPDDFESLSKGMKLVPVSFFRLLLLNAAIASFFSGLTASVISKRITIRPALVIGIVLTLSGLYNAINQPAPAWFSIAGLLIYLPFSLLGYQIVKKQNLRP